MKNNIKRTSTVILGLFFTYMLIAVVAQQRTQAAGTRYVWPYEEQQFNSILNNHRTGLGSGSLKRSACLTQAARDWAKTMSDNNSQYHSDVPAQIAEYCGSTGYTSLAENIANGTFMFSEDAYTLWYNSAGHRSNMEAADFEYTGIAFYFEPDTMRVWGVQMFVACPSSGCSGAVTALQYDDLTTYDSRCINIKDAPSTINAGEKFNASFTFENINGSVWFGNSFSAYSLNDVWGVSSAHIGPEPGIREYRINPGIQAWTATKSFQAPNVPGTYEFSWKMKGPSGTFGATCSKTITVQGSNTGSGTPPTASPASPSTVKTPSPSPNQTQETTDDKQTLENVTQIEGLSIKKANGEVVDISKTFTISTKEELIFEGKAKPNALIKLTVYSEPKEFTSTADNDGNYRLVVSALDAGDHHAELVITDLESGESSDPVTIAQFSVLSDEVAAGKTARSDNLSNDVENSLNSLVFVKVGVVLLIAGIITGFYVYKRKKRARSGS